MADEKQFKAQCKECKNAKTLTEDEAKVGRWFECDYCGATYSITAVNEDGSVEIELVEEEK
ncbi:MAG: hypothetical protein HYV77_03075 [Candidatus Wildermuthbacteria bacterium]|nr:hypothetical protein [Candidatus Wildermuthbacteria bacterium]